jgi:Kdo2-lipid IVA lauroyltransferase/acyltransferase
MQWKRRVGYFFFKVATTLFGWMPWSWAHGFSDFLGWMLCKVVRYRSKVALGNIQRCFPEHDAAQQEDLLQRQYRHLADLVVESLKGFSEPKQSLFARFNIVNGHELAASAPGSYIVAAAHIANFEWGATVLGHFIDRHVVGLYKPIHNKMIDDAMKRQRSHLGTEMVPVAETAKIFDQYRNEQVVYGMVAEQGPSSVHKAIWAPFFGAEVPCLHGLESYAKKYNLPIYYLGGHRIKRGWYEGQLELLVENPNELPDGEIMSRFMARVEKHIRIYPDHWLWTHRRFKLVRDTKKETV